MEVYGMTETKREFTPVSIGALKPDDFKTLLELLPSYNNLSDIDKGLYLRLATTVHHIESEAVFWLKWANGDGAKKVSTIKALRVVTGCSLKEGIALYDEGSLGPLDDERVDEFMAAFNQYEVEAKVEILK
jgi:hypothetical protein